MRETGKVSSVKGKLAEIELDQSPQCVKCGACIFKSSGNMSVLAENTINAKVGDTVEVEISQAARFIFPSILYGLPILFLMVGIVVGNIWSERMGIVLGIVFLLISLLVLFMINRLVEGRKRFGNRIVRVEI